MSERADTVFLQHIPRRCHEDRVVHRSNEGIEFAGESKTHDAVIRQLEIIGEATKNLSASLRAGHPEMPWKDIAGMRHRLIHGYLAVDMAAVCDTATKDVPALRAKTPRHHRRQPGVERLMTTGISAAPPRGFPYGNA